MSSHYTREIAILTVIRRHSTIGERKLVVHRVSFEKEIRMSPNLDSLTSQALALPPGERVVLAHLLWESVEGRLDEDEELFAEIARREAEMAKGTVKTYSHEEVMRDAKRILGQ
jgi:putative addiction module component (TIGR02574 family)